MAPFGVLRLRQNDKTTLRHRAVLRVSLATRQKGDNNIGGVVAIDNASRKLYQFSLNNIQIANMTVRKFTI
jgi:hypothetical protein